MANNIVISVCKRYFQIYAAHMGHFGGNGVDKYFNTCHVCLYVTGTIMMKDFDQDKKYMRRWVYFQFSGKHRNLMNYCFSVPHVAKVTAIIEWPIYINDNFAISSLLFRYICEWLNFGIFFKLPCIVQLYAWFFMHCKNHPSDSHTNHVIMLYNWQLILITYEQLYVVRENRCETGQLLPQMLYKYICQRFGSMISLWWSFISKFRYFCKFLLFQWVNFLPPKSLVLSTHSIILVAMTN